MYRNILNRRKINNFYFTVPGMFPSFVVCNKQRNDRQICNPWKSAKQKSDKTDFMSFQRF